MRLDWSAFHAYAKRPLLTLPAVAFLLLVCPLLVFAILLPVNLYLGFPRPLTEAIVLMAAGPPITGTVAIALILGRSEEHTSELQSLMRISYAVFCLKKKKIQRYSRTNITKAREISR